jgi:uncharacterized protein (DUF58 family)
VPALRVSAGGRPPRVPPAKSLASKPPAGRGVARREAEALAARLPPLLIAALRVAATVEQGVHGRRRIGTGEAFWQFRQYQPGEPATRIDWRQSAKSDRLFLRETEWAAAQSVWLWRDASPSMDWRSSDKLALKTTRADVLTLALAALLLRAGERVALLGSDLPPSSSRAALERMALELEAGGGASLPPSAPLPRHAQLVLIGDFLSPLPAIELALRPYAERGLKGHLLLVADPAEESLPFFGRVRFEGLEAEGELLLSRVESVREAYADRFRLHREGLRALTRALGWTMAESRTDRPAEPGLLALYRQIAESTP